MGYSVPTTRWGTTRAVVEAEGHNMVYAYGPSIEKVCPWTYKCNSVSLLGVHPWYLWLAVFQNHVFPKWGRRWVWGAFWFAGGGRVCPLLTGENFLSSTICGSVCGNEPP